MVFLAISRDLGACPSRGEAAQKRICALWSEPRRTYPSPATWMVNRKWRKVAVFWSWRIIFFFFFDCWCRPEAAQNLTPFPFFSLLSCLFVSLFLPIDTTRAWLSESLVKELLSISRLIFFLLSFDDQSTSSRFHWRTRSFFQVTPKEWHAVYCQQLFCKCCLFSLFFPSLIPIRSTDRSRVVSLTNELTALESILGPVSWSWSLFEVAEILSGWRKQQKKNRRQHLASRWSFADDETTQWRGSSSLAIAQNHYRALHRVVGIAVPIGQIDEN